MSQTEEITTQPYSFTQRMLRFFAGLISYVLHPIFIPVYVVYFLMWIHPDIFAGFSEAGKFQTLVIVVLNLVVFPLVTVLLLKSLGFVSSILLRERKDRIIPYIACGIFFFWGYTVFKEQTRFPLEWVSFVLGIFIAVSGALIANIYFKISMHGMAMGGWLCFMVLLMKDSSVLLAAPLCIVLLLTGLSTSSRLILNAHKPFEMYAGLIWGMAAQIAAYCFVL